ncbi:MAG: methionine--tRNA ligase [Halobacteriota archaeon]
MDYPKEEPTLVTCALPYANGKAHLGHLRTYIPGDVLTRSLRKVGQETTFVCGSDMHGTPIVVNAEQQGREPEDLATEYHDYFTETFPRIDVDFDHYGHTHQDSNVRRTQEIVRALEENGYVYEDTMKVAYDPEADRTLPDRYVEGTCPYCGNDEARGDECDECGRHLEPGEIEDPVSKVTGAPAEYVEQEHRFFALSELTEFLREFVDGLRGTSNARNQPKGWIEDGLQDWCITRDLDWGVPYPGDDELVLYVWVDAPIEYIASTEEWAAARGQPDAWERYWRDDGEIVHVIGGDIIQHHCVFWPALLHGAGYETPDAVLASGLVKIDDRAFSTSKGRAVWLDEDYLDVGLDPDLIRYYIVSYTGFENDLNFSWPLFQERVNNELVDIYGNFVYRSLLLSYDNYDGLPDGTLSQEVEDEIDAAVERFRRAVDDLEVKEVAEAGMALAGYGNEYIQRNEPWRLVDDDPERAAEVLYDSLAIARAAALLLEPVIPSAAERVWSQLGEGDVHGATLDAATAPLDGEPREPEPLFEQVEDDLVDELDARVGTPEEQGEADGESLAEVDAGDDGADADETPVEGAVDDGDEIPFERFEELDLRVAEVVSAEEIEDSDSLLLLEVDVGDDVRQVVAGLKGLHAPADLVGSRVVVVTNLETASIFGYDSEAMLLAAGEDADLLTTAGDSAAGTRVR